MCGDFLAIIPVRVLYMVVKHVMGRSFLTSLLSPSFGIKYVTPVVSQSGACIIELKVFVICLCVAGKALLLLLLLLSLLYKQRYVQLHRDT